MISSSVPVVPVPLTGPWKAEGGQSKGADRVSLFLSLSRLLMSEEVMDPGQGSPRRVWLRAGRRGIFTVPQGI